MSEIPSFWDAVSGIVGRDDRYQPEAYAFVMEAIDLAVGRLPVRGHVTAEELLHGILDLARDRFGLLAASVLREWGITTTGAVGDIVFHLIDERQLTRRDDDSREAFEDVFELEDALESGYFDEGGEGERPG